MNRPGRFIMIDGIAGSGKSTILRAIQTWAEICQYRIFRLSDWTDLAPPRFEDIENYDVYFTYEPTRTWIGRAIRYELSRENDPYGGEELAHAFALDRQILYRRLIIPALQAGKTIIQDRGISSSLVYQPIMPSSISLESLLNLPGNKLALQHAPTALILTKLPAEEAYKRTLSRQDDSKGVFGQLAFLQQVEIRFHEPWLKQIFTSHGSKIFALDTNRSFEETQRDAQQLIDHIFTTC